MDINVIMGSSLRSAASFNAVLVHHSGVVCSCELWISVCDPSTGLEILNCKYMYIRSAKRSESLRANWFRWMLLYIEVAFFCDSSWTKLTFGFNRLIHGGHSEYQGTRNGSCWGTEAPRNVFRGEPNGPDFYACLFSFVYPRWSWLHNDSCKIGDFSLTR